MGFLLKIRKGEKITLLKNAIRILNSQTRQEKETPKRGVGRDCSYHDLLTPSIPIPPTSPFPSSMSSPPSFSKSFFSLVWTTSQPPPTALHHRIFPTLAPGASPILLRQLALRSMPLQWRWAHADRLHRFESCFRNGSRET